MESFSSYLCRRKIYVWRYPKSIGTLKGNGIKLGWGI
jgi:hypothetical protein